MISFKIALKRKKIVSLKNTDLEFSRTLCCRAKFRAFVLRPHRYYLYYLVGENCKRLPCT